MIAPASHSAVVRMELLANGKCIPLAQMCHDFLIPEQPIDLPAGVAEVVLDIDGAISRTNVFLPQGGCSTNSRIPVTSANTE